MLKGVLLTVTPLNGTADLGQVESSPNEIVGLKRHLRNDQFAPRVFASS